MYCVMKPSLKVTVVTIESEDLISVTIKGAKYPKNGKYLAFYNNERVAYEHLGLLKAQAGNENAK